MSARPVLRYHGGKWRLAPWIISHFPEHRVYVEPFGGGGSVLMRKPRAHAEVYNDLDDEVVNVFRVLRDPRASRKLQSLLRLTPFARREYVAAQEHDVDAVERARRTLVRSWLGFGAGAITHRHAGFRLSLSERRHTPREWAGFSTHLTAFTDRLAGVAIEHRDALSLIKRLDASDVLFYVDPPYLLSSRGARHRYRHELTERDHIALAGVLRAAAGFVALSGYASDLYEDLYRGWRAVGRSARDALSRGRTEVLWLNPACTRALEKRRGA